LTYPGIEFYPHYKSITQFVAKSYELLTNSKSAEKLSNLQFNDVSLNIDVDQLLYLLEDIYLQIINK